jgi:hypothetical protein
MKIQSALAMTIALGVVGAACSTSSNGGFGGALPVVEQETSNPLRRRSRSGHSGRGV